MGTSLNNLPLHKAYAGAAEVSNIYGGSNLIWTNTPVIPQGLQLVGESVALGAAPGFGGIDVDDQYIYLALSGTGVYGVNKYSQSTLGKIGQYSTAYGSTRVAESINFLTTSSYYNIIKINKSTLAYIATGADTSSTPYLSGVGNSVDKIAYTYTYGSQNTKIMNLNTMGRTSVSNAATNNLKRNANQSEGWLVQGSGSVASQMFNGLALFKTLPVVAGSGVGGIAATSTTIYDARTLSANSAAIYIIDIVSNVVVKTVNLNFPTVPNPLMFNLEEKNGYLYFTTGNLLCKYNLALDTIETVEVSTYISANNAMKIAGDYVYVAVNPGTNANTKIAKYTL